jgi:hypothetical protein
VSDAPNQVPPGWNPHAPAAPLVAPAGTRTDTVWAWLIAALPILTLIPLLTIDWSGYLTGLLDPTLYTSSSPDVSALLAAEFAIFLAPGYLVSILLSWLLYGATAFFAFRDTRELAARGVPKPFHWAFSFIGASVYIIGRTVVVRRRTGGGGLGPLWVLIAVFVLSIAVSIYLVVVIMSAVFAAIPAMVV